MRSFSDFLSIGYLYLLVLGVVSDSIFYGILGINIMSYSSVLDVLLSPVVHLTSGLVFPVFIIIIPAASYFLLKWKKKSAERNVVAGKKPDIIATLPLLTLWAGFSAWVILSAYIGLGLGGGNAVSKKLGASDFKPDRVIVFNDDTETPVKMVGNNSGYLFYIEKGKDFVTVSPVNGVRKIQKTAK
jgi:hypothetical protein